MAAEKPHYLDHRKRLRQRFEKTGADGFHDYELLELLLTYAIPRRDVKPVAKRLIEHFGHLAGVLDASQQELQRVAQVGPASAVLIRLIKQMCNQYLAQRLVASDVLSSPAAVTDFARMKLAGLSHEAFMVIYLNTQNGVIHYDVLHEGTIDHAIVYPRRIFEAALNCHASGLILVHNHPSGRLNPSDEDKRLTRSLADAARALDIRILDHIIVGKDGYFSFAENHLLSAS